MPSLLRAHLRHAVYYKLVLRAANDLYLQGGAKALSGINIFDAESANIRAAFAWCVTHSVADNMAQALCSDFPFVGAQLLHLRLPPREYMGWIEPALSAAERLGASHLEAAYLINIAVCYSELNEPRRALEFCERALPLFRSGGDHRGESTVLMNVGNAYARLGEYRLAKIAIERSLGLATQRNSGGEHDRAVAS